MNLSCSLGFHKWLKASGLINAGGGKFKSTYRCSVCNKSKTVIK